MSLGSNYSYAPIRQSNIAGGGRFKYNDVHRKFDRWLHSAGTTLMSFSSNNIQSSILPTGGRVGGQLDIMKAPIIIEPMRIPYRIWKVVCTQSHGKWKNT